MNKRQQPEIPLPCRLSHRQKLLFPPNAGFTTIMIDKGEEVLWQKNKWVNPKGMLNASQVKAVFKGLVKNAIIEKGYQR